MKNIYLIFLLLVSSTYILAQDDEADADLIFDNYTYVDYIKSVTLHPPGLIISNPIIQLGSGALSLSFDDLKGESREYIYSVVHCNADWTPSELTPIEFMVGFNEERIQNVEFSIRTLVDYTHYEVTIPNEDFQFSKSGNYLLKVYDNEDDKFLVLSRRFMVVEPSFSVRGSANRSSIVKKGQTHQEIDFVILHKGIQINNPRKEVTVTVLQNGRWDNAIAGLEPQYISGNELKYEFLDKISFLAGKEFRFFDLRSLQYRGNGVRGIEEYNDGYDVTLIPDETRAYTLKYNQRDINGNYVIGNMDNNNNGTNLSFSEDDSEEARDTKLELLARQSRENGLANGIESDYANVLFSIKRNEPFYDDDVYIFGAMTDWQIKDEFKMTYQEAVRAYVADVTLKQGFYNYKYAIVPQKGKKVPNLSELEGDWYETENQYTVLAYFRPFGQRYDRLMVAYNIDSRRRR